MPEMSGLRSSAVSAGTSRWTARANALELRLGDRVVEAAGRADSSASGPKRSRPSRPSTACTPRLTWSGTG